MNETERFRKIIDILQAHNRGSDSFRDHEFFKDFSGEDFNNEEKIIEIIHKIEEYEVWDEAEKKYPTYIYENVRQNLGMNKYDTSRDEFIENMPRDEILDRVCYWNNLINFGDTIKEWIIDIYNVNLDN